MPDEYTVVDYLASFMTQTQMGATRDTVMTSCDVTDMRMAWAQEKTEEPKITLPKRYET